MKRYLLIGFVAALGVIAAYTVLYSKAPQGNVQSMIGTVSTSTINEETVAYSVIANFPQYGIPALDAKIKEEIEKGIASIKTYPPIENDSGTKNGFLSLFEDSYVGPDYVSVKLVMSEYTGGAHDNPWARGITYDRSKGTFLTLDDALALTGKTLPQVAAQAKKSISDDLRGSIFAEGFEPDPKNYDTFIVQEHSVRFIFQPYQVAPFAAGFPVVDIPRIR